MRLGRCVRRYGVKVFTFDQAKLGLWPWSRWHYLNLHERRGCLGAIKRLSANLLFCIRRRISAPPGFHDRRGIPQRAHVSVRERFDRQARCRCNACSAIERRRDGRIATPSHFASWRASLAKRMAMPVLGRFASRHLRQPSSRRNQMQAVSTCGSLPGQPHS